MLISENYSHNIESLSLSIFDHNTEKRMLIKYYALDVMWL